MKPWRLTILALLFLLVPAFTAQSAFAGVSFDFFYSNLSPHGSWLVSAQYGQVWRPAVASPGWNPYSDGHWVYSDVGWVWVSDYDWGALPYHYGTWVLDPVDGWVWVPGYVWAPSWVVFRTGPDYVGWAPVLPGFSVGVSLNAAFPAFDSFIFVSSSRFLAPDIRSCVFPAWRARLAWRRTRSVSRFSVRNDIVVNRGPDLGFIERAGGRRVRPVPVERVRRVAWGDHPSRSQFRVGSRRAGEGLRAAEPRRWEGSASRRARSETFRPSRLGRSASTAFRRGGRSQEVRERSRGRMSPARPPASPRREATLHRGSLSRQAPTRSSRVRGPSGSRQARPDRSHARSAPQYRGHGRHQSRHGHGSRR